MLAIYWNPNPVCFTIPLWKHAIAWYGLFFATGFFCGFLIFKNIFFKFIINNYSFNIDQTKIINNRVADILIWYVFIGTVVGARLGHVFFYDWPIYRDSLIDIFKVWEGGLASHGGAIGVFIGLCFSFFKIRKELPGIKLLHLLDYIVAPAALVGTFIRVGNFFNQEILGTPTNLPWAVIFGAPFDGSAAVARHPAQLYEAIFYFFTFLILFYLSSRPRRTGMLTGIFFILVFAFRFMIEFIKEVESLMVAKDNFFSMGQYLSIPFILIGVVLIVCIYNIKTGVTLK